METVEPWKSEVGNFEYIKKLGEGGFGEVWLADDLRRGEKVAVKFLHLKHCDQYNIDVFKREFEILAELKQVHLARVFDFGFSSENEQYFLSTEFCPGKNLVEAIEGKSAAYFQEILVQILSALECIHSQGIIHFDIKPENVLVEEVEGQPNVKLVDFGVAAKLKALPEQLGGTLVFTAPEVLARSPKLDHRVDLYSLGMLCLFCLTRRLPFSAYNSDDVVEWHRSGRISPNLWKGREVPGHLREITEKLLAKNPSDRFSNSRVVLNFLNLATGGKYRREEAELHAQIPIEGPIVERREEVLRPIQQHIEKTLFAGEADAGSSVYYISGEAGIGKSRVLEEIRHWIQLKEVRFLQIDCDWNIPAWPKLEKWLNVPPFVCEPLDHNWQTRRRMDAVMEAAKDVPLCLLIDDFHKADQDLRSLVLELATHTRKLREAGHSIPLFILVATEEEVEGSARLPHLSANGISNYLKLVLGERIPIENLAEVLFQYSGGLPLLMVEGLRFLVPYFFRRESLENLLRPEKIHRLYEEKLKKLKPAEEELLLTLALLFRPASELELLNIHELTSPALIELAENCFKSGLLSGNPFGEPIYRVSSQALALDLIGGLGPERRRLLHHKIVRGLEKCSGIQIQELAYHSAKAGENTEAVQYYRQAGNLMEQEAKIASACDFFTRALALLETGSEPWRQLSLKVFRLLSLSGNYQAAGEYPAKLAAYPSWERDENLGWFYFKTRQFQKARENYEAALKNIPEGEGLHRILIENALGTVDLQEGKIADAVSRFRKTFEREREIPAEERIKINNNDLGLSLSLMGEHEEAIQFYRKRLEDLPPELVMQRLAFLNGIGYSCLRASRYEEAISSLKQAMTLAESSGALNALFTAMGNLLTALLKENRYVEALAILQKTVSYQRRFGTRRDIAHNLLRQGSVYLNLGMGEFAHENFQEGHRIAQEVSDRILSGWFLLMKAYWEREFGGFDKSAEYFHQAETEANIAENDELRAWAQYGVAEISFDQGALEECRRYLDGIRSQGRDHEFDTRISLLRAKISPASDPGPHFADLEKECLRNNYRELLWEVYQAWAQSCLRRKSREEALEKFEKGFQIIEGIASTLPEEYQTRYRNQRARKKFVEEREAASASDKGGIFSRFKKIF